MAKNVNYNLIYVGFLMWLYFVTQNSEENNGAETKYFNFKMMYFIHISSLDNGL